MEERRELCVVPGQVPGEEGMAVSHGRVSGWGGRAKSSGGKASNAMRG